MKIKCFICQKNPPAENDVRCPACIERMDNPPCSHEWDEFKFSPTSAVTYYTCKLCGEQRMTAEQR